MTWESNTLKKPYKCCKHWATSVVFLVYMVLVRQNQNIELEVLFNVIIG